MPEVFPVQTHGDVDPDVREYLAPIWRRKWLILIIVVAATAGTYSWYDSKPKVYRATTSIYVQGDQVTSLLGQSSASTSTDRNTVNQATLLQSRGVATEVARRLRFRGDP